MARQHIIGWFSKPTTQSLYAFLVSTFIHLTVCLTLAFILISAQGDGSKTGQFAIDATEETDELTELDLAVDSSLVEPEVLFDTAKELTSMSPMIATTSNAVLSSIGRTVAHDNVAAQAAAAVSLVFGHQQAGRHVVGAAP